MKAQRIDARSVNGDGPRCGCGHVSKLHVIGNGTDIFLCVRCAVAATEAYIRRTGQDDQGPPGSGEYWYGLLAREHDGVGRYDGPHRSPVRWCPKCEQEAKAA